MNLLDTILPALVDSAFPIVRDVTRLQDYPLPFWLLGPVVYDCPVKKAGDEKNE